MTLSEPLLGRCVFTLSGGRGIDQDLLDFEIIPKGNLQLFEQVYREYVTIVKNICEKPDVVEVHGKTNWGKLDSKIKTILVDLRYRGDYAPETRAHIQGFVAKNDVKGFAKEMAKRKRWSDVPENRFRSRLKYLKET